MTKSILMFYYRYQVRAIDICDPEHPFFISELGKVTYCLKRGEEVREVAYTDKNYRLLLYPLEDLTRECIINGERIIPIKYIYSFITRELNILDDGGNYGWFLKNLIRYLENRVVCRFSKDMLNWIYYILFSFHFDIYGLIKNEEAYDVFLLEQNPYKDDRILLPDE